MLFKNWKLLFENTNQTPLYLSRACSLNDQLVFSINFKKKKIITYILNCYNN